MQNLRQDIRIFQDTKDNKTTIVCWGLSKATKEKLVSILLGDIQAVETISGVNNIAPDYGRDVQDTSYMQPVVPTPVIDDDLKNLPVEQQISELIKRYHANPSLQIAQTVKALIPQLYDANENTMRFVLYEIRNLSTHTIDDLCDQMGVKHTPGLTDRDQCVQTALVNAPKETLNAALRKIAE